MGQGHSYLKKFTVKDENDRINYATSTMQGLRSYMEDAVSTVATTLYSSWDVLHKYFLSAHKYLSQAWLSLLLFFSIQLS
jgi:hypothetical protein